MRITTYDEDQARLIAVQAKDATIGALIKAGLLDEKSGKEFCETHIPLLVSDATFWEKVWGRVGVSKDDMKNKSRLVFFRVIE